MSALDTLDTDTARCYADHELHRAWAVRAATATSIAEAFRD